MAYEHLYQPVPCSHWVKDLLHSVETAYREARGKGLEPLAGLDEAETAHIAASGLATDARDMVVAIIASGKRPEQGRGRVVGRGPLWRGAFPPGMDTRGRKGKKRQGAPPREAVQTASEISASVGPWQMSTHGNNLTSCLESRTGVFAPIAC